VSFFDEAFSLPAVAPAVGVQHDSLSKWIRRGHLVLRPQDREKVGRGGGVNLSASTTLQAILAGDLARRGLLVPDACEAALPFAHEGSIAGEMGATHSRAPGRLFPEGQITLLLIDRDRPENSTVRAFDENTPLKDLRSRLDAIDVELVLMRRLGLLGIDVHAAMKEIRGQ
jgi:hypothetical protein